MKKLLILFWSLSLCLCNPEAFAQQNVEQQNSAVPQYLKNAGFENKTTGWTVAAGTKTFPKTTGDKIAGQGFKLAFTSINGSLISQTYADCADLSTKNMLTGIHIKTTTANVEVCSQVNGVDQQCLAVPTDGVMRFVPATFVASANTCGLRVKTTSSTSGDVTVDAARLLENTWTGVVDDERVFTYTPLVQPSTGTITNYNISATVTVKGSRVFIDGRANFTGAGGTWTDPSINLPSEFPMNTAATPQNSVIGSFKAHVGGGNIWDGSLYVGAIATQVFPRTNTLATHTGTQPIYAYGGLTGTFPGSWNNGDYFSFQISYQTTNPLVSNVFGADTPMAPTEHVLTSGTSFSVPTGAKLIEYVMIGGGGGGQGSGTAGAPAQAGSGGSTTFAGLTAGGGAGGGQYLGGSGGTCSGSLSYPGSSYCSVGAAADTFAVKGAGADFGSASGAASRFGGNGKACVGGGVGFSAVANSGSGGGGSCLLAATNGVIGAGGGAGALYEGYITGPFPATLTYAIGAAGAAGVAGTGGNVGGAGGTGRIYLRVHYSFATMPFLKQAVIAGDTSQTTVIHKMCAFASGTVTVVPECDTYNLFSNTTQVFQLPPAASMPGRIIRVRAAGTTQAIITPASGEAYCGKSVNQTGTINGGHFFELQSYTTTWLPTNGRCRNTAEGQFSGASFITNACTASPCTLNNVAGVSSVTRNSTGSYTINFMSGYFQTTARLTGSMICSGAGGETRVTAGIAGGSGSSVVINTFNGAGGGLVASDVSCMFSFSGDM